MNKEPLSSLNQQPFTWKKAWTECIVIVLVLRMIYAAIGIGILFSGGPSPLQETVYELIDPYLKMDGFSRYFVNPWFQWDTISYMKIAIMGYERDATVAFMPLYPMLIRLLGGIMVHNYLLAALVLSTLFTMIDVILLYELFREYYSEEIGHTAVILFLTFPTAFFLLAGYTESLFLMFVLLFWLSARRKKWLFAGLCAGLAALTRMHGIVLSVVMLWMILVSLLESNVKGQPGLFRGLQETLQGCWKKMSLSSGLAAVTPLIVTVGYQAWLKGSGLGTTSEALHKYWKMDTVMPWTGFVLFVQRIATNHYRYMDWIDLALLLLVIAAALIGLRRLDPAFSLYIWLTLAVLWMRGTPPHLLASYSRYFLAFFPLFVLPALRLSRYPRLALVTIFFSLQVLLVTIFLWGSWVA